MIVNSYGSGNISLFRAIEGMDGGEDCSGWVACDCAPGTEDTKISKAASDVDVESLG